MERWSHRRWSITFSLFENDKRLKQTFSYVALKGAPVQCSNTGAPIALAQALHAHILQWLPVMEAAHGAVVNVLRIRSCGTRTPTF